VGFKPPSTPQRRTVFRFSSKRSAWAYRGQARVGQALLCRQNGLPQPIIEIAWKAQLRLTGRFRRLAARGKSHPKVATAIARELTGFVWDIARHVPVMGRQAADMGDRL
jgi:hypothetical protein